MSWVLYILIVILFVWVWDLSETLRMLAMLNHENEEKIVYLQKQRDKLWKKVSEYEKQEYELHEAKAKIDNHILKTAYKEWYNNEKDPSKRFSAIESYWVKKNFGDINYDSPAGREKYNAFSFVGVKDKYMIVHQRDASDVDQYWSFKRAFLDINYRDYALFVPGGPEIKYYDQAEIDEIMKGIK